MYKHSSQGVILIINKAEEEQENNTKDDPSIPRLNIVEGVEIANKEYEDIISDKNFVRCERTQY